VLGWDSIPGDLVRLRAQVLGIVSSRDTSHLPQIFPQELKPFGRSMDGQERLTSRFGARAVLFEGRRTVRQWHANCPRSSSSLRERLVLLSSCIDLSRS
jgi:hypothetical protein